MADPRVLLVEDDAELRDLLARGLSAEGFAVATAGSATELLEDVSRAPADVLVVDIGLPDADGRDLCQALRAQGVQAPLLFLTARDAVTDRLAGFDAGGDDYLTKPFDFDELVARLRALLRRSTFEPADEVAGLRLDPASHAVSCGDESAELTPTEFRLLAMLASQPGDAVRRRALLAAGWPRGAIVHDNTLDVYVARLRRKLRELPGAPEIATVHGVGYSLR
jgi:two-component system, OmpR family, response regulator